MFFLDFRIKNTFVFRNSVYVRFFRKFLPWHLFCIEEVRDCDSILLFFVFLNLKNLAFLQSLIDLIVSSRSKLIVFTVSVWWLDDSLFLHFNLYLLNCTSFLFVNTVDYLQQLFPQSAFFEWILDWTMLLTVFQHPERVPWSQSYIHAEVQTWRYPSMSDKTNLQDKWLHPWLELCRYQN